MMKKRLMLFMPMFLMCVVYIQAQHEVLTINNELISMSNNITEQSVLQKLGENSPQVTVKVFKYIFGVNNRALTIFEVTPNSYTALHRGGFFTDEIFNQYGYDFLVDYCRKTEDKKEVFTSAHKDTILCHSGDILHAIFIAEDINGIQSDHPVYLKVTVPAPTSNETVENNDLQLFPIPNNGNFTITSDNFDANANINIFSITGKKVYSTTVTSNKQNISLPNLSDGIYLIQYTSKKRSMVKHLIIKK